MPRPAHLSSGEQVKNLEEKESALKRRAQLWFTQSRAHGRNALTNSDQYESAMLSLALLASKKRSVLVITGGMASPLA